MGRGLPFGSGDVGMFPSTRIRPGRTAFAFSGLLHPHFRQRALRFRLPHCSGAEIRVFHVDNQVDDLGPSCTPAAMLSPQGKPLSP